MARKWRIGTILLAASSLFGCSNTEEPPPRLTRAEYDEIRSYFPYGKNQEGRDRYFASARGRALIAKRLKQVVGDRGASILRNATKVEAFRIADTAGLDDGGGDHHDVRSTLGKIDGYTITSVGSTMNADFAARLSGYLLNGEHYFISLDCMPDSGVAFRAWWGRESVSIIICYECDHLNVFVHDKHGSTVHRGASYFTNELGEAEVLIGLALEAFPHDQEILSMRK